MESQAIVDLLTTRTFPELATALRAQAREVFVGWETLVRQTLPRADQLTFEQLRDDVPDILEQIARSLESNRRRNVGELLALAPMHGVTRFHQSFSLSEMLIEYDLLRASVLDQVVAHLGRRIEAEEVVGLNGALDLAARRAILAFVEYQSQELRAANEAQSKYLSFLSHDLRGGLNGVFLMIEVLKRELAHLPKLSETIKDMDSMRRSLLETVGTMDRFLHAERFRKGKVQLKSGPVQIGPLLFEAASQSSYQAKDKVLDLRTDVPSDCAVTSDRELLSVIVHNLISNAVKYTQSGEVVASAKPTEQGGCLISVRDTGPGIAAERLTELFAPFARGDTHGQPGVGLGLSIARQAAEVLGARLWAESIPGQGSTFHLRLPSKPPAKS